MTTTAMKRAGQLVAHLETLHQISDVRQLLLLQLAMRERQDQVALFRRQDGAVTLSLIGVQMSAPTGELSHRAGNVPASALLGQLQDVSGIRGDDVAFSSGQLNEMIAAQTRKIEASEGLARLDAALLGMIGKLEQEQQAGPEQAVSGEAAEAASSLPADASGTQAPVAGETVAEGTITGETEPSDDDRQAEPDAGLSSIRVSRRRSA